MSSKTVKDLVAEAKSKATNLSIDEFAREAAAPNVVVIDVREPGERAASGAIPGSLHVPRGLLEFHADPTHPYHKKELDPARRVLVYCATGGRSALASVALAELGYRDVAHLDTGFKAWKEAGRPVAPADG